MTDSISTTGLEATVPRHVVTSEGLPITNFRLAATQRKFNRSTQTWEYGETNWFTVTAFRQLAMNFAGSIAKGDRVLVSGRLRIRDWENGERAGTIVEIDASSVGHDLNWGTASFTRSAKADAAGVSPEVTGAAELEGEASPFDPDEQANAAVELPVPDAAGEWKASA
jgi:single-strand DNA-binding protein